VLFIYDRGFNICNDILQKLTSPVSAKKQILLAFEAFDAFVANETSLAPTNEMCNVDEGDIRNKGNRFRKKCF